MIDRVSNHSTDEECIVGSDAGEEGRAVRRLEAYGT